MKTDLDKEDISLGLILFLFSILIIIFGILHTPA